MTYYFCFLSFWTKWRIHNLSEEYILRTFSVGYFACAQYDVRSPIGTSCHFPRRRKHRNTSFWTVVKNPTEELTGICTFFTLVVGYFADAQYDVFFCFLSFWTVVKNPTEKVRKYMLYHFGRGIFRWRSIWRKIPYRHFVPLRLRGGRAPFVAIATFPPFQRGNLPRRRNRGLFYCLCEGAQRLRQTPGRVNYRTLLSPIVGVADTFPEGESKKNSDIFWLFEIRPNYL